MNNPVFVVVPQPSVTINHPNQILFPGSFNQTSGIIQHSGHPLMTVNTINQLSEQTGPRQNMHTGGRLITLLREELKVLGAIQILIGLVHFGFGSILTYLCGVYISYTITSAYVYWGGVLFTTSGSLMVAAEHYKTLYLVNLSICMNIVSSLGATAGIILFLMDENLFFSYHNNFVLQRKLAQGLLNVLLIFTILELFLGVISSSFGCEAKCHQGDEEATHFMPDGIITHQGELLPADPPPSYEAYANTGFDNPSYSGQAE
ncbi:membrane-spanning 4-domains subfamily A member 15-like [Sceloporus undulatus]|uniref:membrane-spanning 4-domains subfamily A member 15-like n=1 Tax=Sceloporus undulatus TaxID=8520 RepID=UPI001C4ABF8E|nr:membrane-spanning 4-domains subfamily A member 15-like [Sceloporus undulatus]